MATSVDPGPLRAGEGLRRRMALLALMPAIAAGGCAYACRLPPRARVPADAPSDVRQRIGWLYSIDPQRRAQGCVDLSAMGWRAAPAVPFLVALLADEAYAWSPSPFWPYTGTPVGNVAATALRCIGEPAVDPLIESLRDRDANVRRRAVCALGRIRDERAFDPLLALREEEPAVHLCATQALLSIPSPRAVEVALASLRDGDTETRRLAIGVLAKGAGDRATGPLLAAAKTDPDDSLRLLAVEALGARCDGEVVDMLHRMLTGADRFHRHAAAKALGRIADRRSVAPLIEALKNDTYADARMGIATVLGRLGDPRALPALREALKDRCWYVRSAAAEAIRRIQASEGAKPQVLDYSPRPQSKRTVGSAPPGGATPPTPSATCPGPASPSGKARDQQ